MNDVQIWMFWATVAGLGLAVLVQGVLVAFTFGRLFERQRNDSTRIAALEASEKEGGSAASALAVSLGRFESDLRHLVDDVGTIKQNMNWMGRIANVGEPHKG